MADAPKTSLARLLSSLPLPDAPYERIEDQIVAQYLRRLHTYLQDLLSKFAVAEANGFILPAVPDLTVDWYLEFIAGDKKIEWFQKPDVWYVTPTVDDDHTAEPDASLGNIAWFNGGATIPAGLYVVGYKSGALDYSSPSGTARLQFGDDHSYYAIYQNALLYASLDATLIPGDFISQDYDGAGSKIVNQVSQQWIGLNRQNYASTSDGHYAADAAHGAQLGIEAAFVGQSMIINHDGSGRVGMRLYDAPRADNAALPGGTLPTFFLHKLSLVPYYRQVL